MTAEFEHVQKVNDALGKKLIPLHDRFNPFAAKPPVNSVGISKDEEGFYIGVGLEREPSKREWKKLPNECDGVRIKYNVIGRIEAL